jgi:hypothetical protein
MDIEIFRIELLLDPFELAVRVPDHVIADPGQLDGQDALDRVS